MYNSNHQKTSLNLHFPLFELSARCPFFTDSLYPSDIFDELVVGFLHPSVYIWGVQNTEKYGRHGPKWAFRPSCTSQLVSFRFLVSPQWPIIAEEASARHCLSSDEALEQWGRPHVVPSILLHSLAPRHDRRNSVCV